MKCRSQIIKAPSNVENHMVSLTQSFFHKNITLLRHKEDYVGKDWAALIWVCREA